MFLLDIHNHPWVEGTKAWQKKVRPVCRNCVETDLRNRMLGFVKYWDFQIWPKTPETWIGGTKGLASLAVCAVPRPLPIGKRWKTRSLAVCFALISARHCAQDFMDKLSLEKSSRDTRDVLGQIYPFGKSQQQPQMFPHNKNINTFLLVCNFICLSYVF